MRKLAPEIRLSGLIRWTARSFVDIGHEAGTEIVSPEFRLAKEREVKAAHQAGLLVLPWTPNTPMEWDRMIRFGVDGIITDDPAALIHYLKSKQ
jgi:glycerophosphoryl diester phosphodiesterase